MILDGGHNPDGTAALAEALNELYPGEKFTTVYAAFADKNASECVRNLSAFTEHFIFTSPGSWNRKSFAPDELIGFAAQYGIPAHGNPAPLEAAAEALKISDRRVMISGSLYLAGEILQEYMPLESTLDI